jgi:30S ribosomal protein S31
MIAPGPMLRKRGPMGVLSKFGRTICPAFLFSAPENPAIERWHPRWRSLWTVPALVHRLRRLSKYLLEILVGKGDRRTRRGKIYAGSFGKSRPKVPKVTGSKKPAAAPAVAKPAVRPAAKTAPKRAKS